MCPPAPGRPCFLSSCTPLLLAYDSDMTTRKKRPGPKKKARADRKGERLMFLATENQRRKLYAAADLERRSFSEWALSTLMERAGEVLG